MSGGEIHKGGEGRFAKLRRAPDGNLSFTEKIERKSLPPVFFVS